MGVAGFGNGQGELLGAHGAHVHALRLQQIIIGHAVQKPAELHAAKGAYYGQYPCDVIRLFAERAGQNRQLRGAEGLVYGEVPFTRVYC